MNEPTRDKMILDLVLTIHSDNALVNVLESFSDHKVVHCQVKVCVNAHNTDTLQYIILYKSGPLKNNHYVERVFIFIFGWF